MFTVSTITAMTSIKKPAMIYISSRPAIIKTGGMGSPLMKFASAKGISVTARKELKIVEPMTSKKIMPAIRPVSISEPVKFVQFNRLLASPRISAPKAPTAPASEGVKNPEYIPPITRRNKTIIPHIRYSAVNRSFQVDLGPPGATPGLSQQTIRIAPMNRMVMRIPGKMPAMKRAPMDSSVKKA